MRFHEIYFQTNADSVGFLSSKKSFLAVVSEHAKIIPKDGASCPNFQQSFCYKLFMKKACCDNMKMKVKVKNKTLEFRSPNCVGCPVILKRVNLFDQLAE